MSDIWQWIYDRRYDAYASDDETRLEMVHLFWQMLEELTTNPELSLQYGTQSRHIADMIGDKWFVQLINHWELQTKYGYIGDYTGTLDLATKAAVEVRLPEYQGFPQRICIHEDLISAYFQEDPIGNRDRVKQALDYMEREVDPSVECFQCLSGLKLDFVRETGTHDETLKAAQIALATNEDSEHHQSTIYLTMVEVAYEQRNWENLLKWAIEAESNARKADRENRLVAVLVWLAVHAQHIQQQDRADMLIQQAAHRVTRYGAFIGGAYYYALSAYHEQGGRLQEAIESQQTYLEQLIGKAKPFRECTALLEMIRLKKGLEQDFEDNVAALKETVKFLKAPDYILDKLKTIIA